MTQQRTQTTSRRRHGGGNLRQRDGRWISQARHPVSGRLISHTHPPHISPITAERLHIAWLAALAESAADPATMTVRGLVDHYLAARTDVAPATLQAHEVALARITARIGATPLAQLDTLTVDRVLADLRRCYAPGTVRVTRGVLHTMLRRAVAWRLIDANPLDRSLPVRTARSARLQIPTTDDIRRIIAAEPSQLWRATWQLLASTGMRPSEARALLVGDVDVAHGRVTVAATMTRGRDGDVRAPRTKTGRDRVVVIDEITGAALAALCAGRPATAHVLTVSDGPVGAASIRQAWARACERAGVPPLRLMSTRHWHASTLLAQGIPVQTVSERLGHGLDVCQRVYGHHVPAGAQAAAVAALPDLAQTSEHGGGG